jgi:putative endopeptidase
LSKTNVLLNLLTLGEVQTKFEMQKLGQPISQQKDWDDAVFVVNAYYYTQANEMVIPSGILQDPFFDEKRSLGWNYGALGCVLCHEITHAFDKEGKEYDPQGFQKKWWSPSDNRNYNKQTEALIDLYSHQKVNGFPVSGRKTLSENIADIGGMGLALDALHEKLDSLKLTGDERKEAYKEFFIAYAVSWRLKEKRKRRIQALITDKHAPPMLRVNLVVSQFQEWYDAFNIQPEDNLYRVPEKRIRIF